MTRPIKFRAWDKRNNKMMETQFMILPSGGLYITLGRMDIKEQDLILTQFTGLLDKNGKEIYEGDIVKRHDGRVGAVKFNHGCFVIAVAGVKALKKLGNKDDQHECEVIGNLYENPNLLK